MKAGAKCLVVVFFCMSTVAMSGCPQTTSKCSSEQVCCIVRTGKEPNAKIEQCVSDGAACLALANTFKSNGDYPQAETSDSTNVCAK